jgi:hypothetical protein
MRIEVIKLTGKELLEKSVKHVFDKPVKATLSRWYESEHSPIRTQMFSIYCSDIPYCVVMQMVRHERNGALFLVQSGRPDTGNTAAHGRMAPRNMFIMCNAQHLIDWSHKRMCNKAESYTRDFFSLLKKEMETVDYELAQFLEPNCSYRNGICSEFKPCSNHKEAK